MRGAGASDRALPFDAPSGPSRGESDSPAALVIDVDGFEGPLDLLLHLARLQKVDLARISILALVEQYLAFIERARALKLEIAADYLVMAAWLAYLKSRLLVPQKPSEAPGGEEMAALLQFRLRRLEAIRSLGERLINRDRLGREFFARGMPETVVVERHSRFQATLYDLLTAYAGYRQRAAITRVEIAGRSVWSLQEARERLERMLGKVEDWTALDGFLIEFAVPETARATAIASSFAASLEMVREGKMEIRQAEAFSPIYLRRRAAAEREVARSDG